MMKIVLTQEVTGLGSPGEIVEVKDGYARNFLLPKKLALPVTMGNKRQIELEKERVQKLRAKEHAEALELKAKLDELYASGKPPWFVWKENGHPQK